MKLLTALVVASLAAGCSATDSGTDQVAGKSVVDAFAAAREPVRLRSDLVETDPDSPIKALYQARDGGVDRGHFGVVILEDDDAAADHAVGILKISVGEIEVVRHKNLVLAMSSTMTPRRRARLVDVLKSL
jgi:hypothetical protein